MHSQDVHLSVTIQSNSLTSSTAANIGEANAFIRLVANVEAAGKGAGGLWSQIAAHVVSSAGNCVVLVVGIGV